MLHRCQRKTWIPSAAFLKRSKSVTAGVLAGYVENIVIREAESLPYDGKFQGHQGGERQLSRLFWRVPRMRGYRRRAQL